MNKETFIQKRIKFLQLMTTVAKILRPYGIYMESKLTASALIATTIDVVDIDLMLNTLVSCSGAEAATAAIAVVNQLNMSYALTASVEKPEVNQISNLQIGDRNRMFDLTAAVESAVAKKASQDLQLWTGSGLAASATMPHIKDGLSILEEYASIDAIAIAAYANAVTVLNLGMSLGLDAQARVAAAEIAHIENALLETVTHNISALPLAMTPSETGELVVDVVSLLESEISRHIPRVTRYSSIRHSFDVLCNVLRARWAQYTDLHGLSWQDLNGKSTSELCLVLID